MLQAPSRIKMEKTAQAEVVGVSSVSGIDDEQVSPIVSGGGNPKKTNSDKKRKIYSLNFIFYLGKRTLTFLILNCSNSSIIKI